MTDNEIKQALEACADLTNDCEKCVYRNKGNDCISNLSKDALDLISRHKAEIKRLTDTLNATIAGQETLQKLLASKEAEIKNLKNACFCIANERDAIGDCMSEAVEEAKADAIKEFAERLKTEAKLRNHTNHGANKQAVSYNEGVIETRKFMLVCIDNLVKERIGE